MPAVCVWLKWHWPTLKQVCPVSFVSTLSVLCKEKKEDSVASEDSQVVFLGGSRPACQSWERNYIKECNSEPEMNRCLILFFLCVSL